MRARGPRTTGASAALNPASRRELAASVRDRETELAAARERIEALSVALDEARTQRAVALELLELDGGGRRLSMVPLFSAVVAVCAALGASLSAYATLLGGSSSWILGGLTSVVLAFGAIGSASNPGAGGAARATLRSVAFAVAIVSAVFLVMGIGIHVGR
jgi:hypothetical protein